MQMEKMILQLERGIIRELEHILLLLRAGSYVGTLALFWFTPMPWKLFVMAPFVLGPTLAVLLPRLPDKPSPAEAAERDRVRALMAGATGTPSLPVQSSGRAAPAP